MTSVRELLVLKCNHAREDCPSVTLMSVKAFRHPADYPDGMHLHRHLHKLCLWCNNDRLILINEYLVFSAMVTIMVLIPGHCQMYQDGNSRKSDVQEYNSYATTCLIW